MAGMVRRYPVPAGEVEPRVFVWATDDWWEVAARFVVPVRTACSVESDLVKCVRDRFDAEGILRASTSLDVTAPSDGGRTTRESSRSG
jgi:hypothetical protein